MFTVNHGLKQLSLIQFHSLHICKHRTGNRTFSQWNLYNETSEVLLKHINFIICLAQSLQNHVYSPSHERPPVLRVHTGFTVFQTNNRCTFNILTQQRTSFQTASENFHHKAKCFEPDTDCMHSIGRVSFTNVSWVQKKQIYGINPSPPKPVNFTDDIFRWILANEKFCILIQISLHFVPKGPIDNNQAMV